MKRGYDRTQRVADLIQKELAQLLLENTGENDFKFVTITSVTVARDLAYAKVYVSILVENDDPQQIKKVVDQLNREAKSFRYQLAQRVKLRIAPELKFIYDDSTARGFRISSLIDSAVKKSEKK